MKQLINLLQEDVESSVKQAKTYRDRFPEHHAGPVPKKVAQRALHANLLAIQRSVSDPRVSTSEQPSSNHKITMPYMNSASVNTPNGVQHAPIQRIKQLSLGVNKKWKEIRSSISTYNSEKELGIIHNFNMLNDIQKKAMNYDPESKNNEIKNLITEALQEQTKLAKGARYFLSKNANSANRKLQIIPSIQLDKLKLGVEKNKDFFFNRSKEVLNLDSVQECYFLKAIAAGHSFNKAFNFLKNIQGFTGIRLYNELNLTPKTDGITQQYADFCSSTTVVILKAHFDPIYAYEIKTKNKNLAIRMKGGINENKSWLKEKINQNPSYDKPQDNHHLLLEQYIVAKKFSTDKSGRLGLKPMDRVNAFNAISDITGLKYEYVSITGNLIIKSGSRMNPKTAIGPKQLDQERIEHLDYLLFTPLKAGAPVGAGVGGHADIFLGLDGKNALLYEPTLGNIRQVTQSDVQNSMTGMDTIFNLILPIINDSKYVHFLEQLKSKGEAEDQILDFTLDPNSIEYAKHELADDLANLYGWSTSARNKYLASDECRRRAQKRLDRANDPIPSYYD